MKEGILLMMINYVHVSLLLFIEPESSSQFISRPETFLKLQLRFKMQFLV